MALTKKRLAIIVSHPIQYYAPLHQRLASRDDLLVKVFFTWHSGQTAVEDRGFKIPVAWDIPLTEGYDFELVPNLSSEPGTHHFRGLRNPSLVKQVKAWRPDAVQVTGWAWQSHLLALRAFSKMGTPILFRGDSHLLDARQQGARWRFKRAILKRVFSWPAGFLVVGTANRLYYETFGVQANRLFRCPHSIDVIRFAEPADRHEQEARAWRRELQIPDDKCVLLFAGKFEHRKRPMELMRTVQSALDSNCLLIMVGGGELGAEVNALAASDPTRFRVLPFQNQSRMPVLYRLGDLFILPSEFGETWGLAVNEALACGRPVLVSDRVGCAEDVVDPSCGRVFSWAEPSSLPRALREMAGNQNRLAEMGRSAAKRAWCFDVRRTEDALIAALHRVCTNPC
jgi:glycosyltransferase involved in cell wall biosynthesis